MKATEFGEITQSNGHYAIQDNSSSPILVPIDFGTILTRMIPSDIVKQALSLCDFSRYVFTGVQSGAGEKHAKT